MQKKLIALAVAGLVSAPALAQSSNVTLYGIIDMGLTHYSSSEESGDHPGLKNRTGIDNGVMSSSRIGLKGTEDLGNGLHAIFNMEWAARGEHGDSDVLGHRQFYVGLQGDFGKAVVGRQWTPHRQFLKGLDPWGNDTLAGFQTLYSVTSRVDNGFVYDSPDFNGFGVSVAYANALGEDEELTFKGDDRDNTRYYSVVPTYNNGPLTVGLGYSTTRNSADDDVEFDQWDLGAGYDFGAVEVTAAFGQKRWDDEDSGVDPKTTQWLLGLSAPVSQAGTVLASFVNIKHDTDVSGESDEKARMFTLGYLHSLSKRTNLYAAYAKINTNSAADGHYGFKTRENTNDEGDVLGNAALTSGINVGIRHKF